MKIKSLGQKAETEQETELSKRILVSGKGAQGASDIVLGIGSWTGSHESPVVALPQTHSVAWSPLLLHSELQIPHL